MGGEVVVMLYNMCVYGMCMLVFMVLVVFVGVKYVNKLVLVFLVCVVLFILVIYVGVIKFVFDFLDILVCFLGNCMLFWCSFDVCVKVYVIYNNLVVFVFWGFFCNGF